VNGEDLDRDARLFVYRHFVEQGQAPSVADTAAGLGRTDEEVAAAFRRLEAAHVLVLAPGTQNIWMANPFSAFPTGFWVETPRGSWWGSCIRDAFGIVAMLDGDGTISSSCADCGSPLRLSVQAGVLQGDEGVAHFAVPARRWWDNIGYT
jgi:hypothetical protein